MENSEIDLTFQNHAYWSAESRRELPELFVLAIRSAALRTRRVSAALIQTFGSFALPIQGIRYLLKGHKNHTSECKIINDVHSEFMQYASVV